VAVRLHHELAGEGPPVLFISGTGGDLRARPNVFDGPLPASFSVLAFDQRGQGRSDKPDVACTMADYADDAACLLDEVGWGRAHVVGVSFGGMVAQELALRHPGAVDRLVLACTSSGGAGGASYPLHELEDLPEEERFAVGLALSDRRRDAAWQAAHPDEVARLAEQAAAAAAPGADDPDLAAGRRRQLAARRGHDTWARLEQVAAPTLVCAGRHDGIAPLANSEALAARIPGATLRVFDGGHLFLVQDRTAWPAIIEFLQEPGGPQPS
jgi:3-oxoadipate enol-lactonase